EWCAAALRAATGAVAGATGGKSLVFLGYSLNVQILPQRNSLRARELDACEPPDGRARSGGSMHTHTGRHWLSPIVCLLIALVVPGSQPAGAICNLIPGTAKTFNSTLGATNRPFAAPGERLELRVRPCDPASAGLTADPANHLVTVIFTPPSGPRYAKIL